MGVRTVVVAVVTSGLVAGLPLATPAHAAQPAKWKPVPLSTLESVVKSINQQAKAAKKARHSPGCFQVLRLSGHKDFVAVNVRPTANVDACGVPAKFGIRAYRKSGSKWVFVGGPTGIPGSACVYSKAATARDKSLLKSSRLCR